MRFRPLLAEGAVGIGHRGVEVWRTPEGFETGKDTLLDHVGDDIRDEDSAGGCASDRPMRLSITLARLALWSSSQRPNAAAGSAGA